MGTWDRIRAALRREAEDLKEAAHDATARGNAALERREREQAATPEEKIGFEQERIAEHDAEYEALKRQIEGR